MIIVIIELFKAMFLNAIGFFLTTYRHIGSKIWGFQISRFFGPLATSSRSVKVKLL